MVTGNPPPSGSIVVDVPQSFPLSVQIAVPRSNGSAAGASQLIWCNGSVLDPGSMAVLDTIPAANASVDSLVESVASPSGYASPSVSVTLSYLAPVWLSPSLNGMVSTRPVVVAFTCNDTFGQVSAQLLTGPVMLQSRQMSLLLSVLVLVWLSL